jgi:hypothetical protein
MQMDLVVTQVLFGLVVACNMIHIFPNILHESHTRGMVTTRTRMKDEMGANVLKMIVPAT